MEMEFRSVPQHHHLAPVQEEREESAGGERDHYRVPHKGLILAPIVSVFTGEHILYLGGTSCPWTQGHSCGSFGCWLLVGGNLKNLGLVPPKEQHHGKREIASNR